MLCHYTLDQPDLISTTESKFNEIYPDVKEQERLLFLFPEQYSSAKMNADALLTIQQ
jgi:hypothetical protein